MDQAIPLELQRVAGSAGLEARVRSGRTRLARLFEEGAAKIRMPAPETDAFEAVLINTAGGLTGGDRLAWRIEVGDAASAVVTTQACEKVYRAGNGRAEVAATLRVGAGGRLAWLPQETIVFDRSAFARTLEAELAPGASLLMLEACLFGRLARGEKVASGIFRDRWRIHMQGRLVHAEDLALGPNIAGMLGRSAVAGGASAIATLLLVGDEAERHVEAARETIGEAGGVSYWSVAGTGKLLARLVAGDGYALRRRLVPLVELLNGRAGLPKVWSV
jgi:urease accessory protein